MRTTHRITTRHGSFIALFMVITWFWRNSVGIFDFGKFSLKISDVFFSRSNTILAISQEWFVRLMWNEKVKFRKSSISGIAGLIDVKWTRSELIWYWTDCMTLPFDHTYDPDLGVKISRSKSEIALSQEWDCRWTWNEKDVSHPFMTVILTSVTMVGWADVPDCDWGDFRHRRAFDISSY